ncbi:hypothetical protein BV25DRAFT_1918557 [Artomyces pyxidatus]|uniref:Uncharacterized protein n=1 Tax=Artomyces pyxidatus TaxID=48021 RepID=A0ACB8SSW3_9AGAM|nr:hypothetical protein BV25DRAFT_1918557 [Artomyces pyxidatus]
MSGRKTRSVAPKSTTVSNNVDSTPLEELTRGQKAARTRRLNRELAAVALDDMAAATSLQDNSGPELTRGQKAARTRQLDDVATPEAALQNVMQAGNKRPAMVDAAEEDSERRIRPKTTTQAEVPRLRIHANADHVELPPSTNGDTVPSLTVPLVGKGKERASQSGHDVSDHEDEDDSVTADVHDALVDALDEAYNVQLEALLKNPERLRKAIALERATWSADSSVLEQALNMTAAATSADARSLQTTATRALPGRTRIFLASGNADPPSVPFHVPRRKGPAIVQTIPTQSQVATTASVVDVHRIGATSATAPQASASTTAAMGPPITLPSVNFTAPAISTPAVMPPVLSNTSDAFNMPWHTTTWILLPVSGRLLLLQSQSRLLQSVLKDAIQLTIYFFTRDALFGACTEHMGREHILRRMQNEVEYVTWLSSVLDPRISLFRLEVKRSCQRAVPGSYNLAPGCSALVDALLGSYNYIYPRRGGGNAADTRKPYRHPIFVAQLREHFLNRAMLESRYGSSFRPDDPEDPDAIEKEVPDATVALIGAAIYCAIREWSTGEYKKSKAGFTADIYADVYNGHIATLEDIRTHKPTSYHRMMADLFVLASSTDATSTSAGELSATAISGISGIDLENMDD